MENKIRYQEKLDYLRSLPKVEWGKMSASGGHAQLKLHYYFNVISFYQDFRGDEGDDGGYTVSISEKDGKYYLHVLYISSNNLEADHWVVTEDEAKNGYPDFFIFDTKEEAQGYLNYLVTKLKDMLEEDKYLYLWDDIDEKEDELEKIETAFLAALSFPFSEYMERDEPVLTDLINYEYIPNFESWEDDDEDYPDYNWYG